MTGFFKDFVPKHVLNLQSITKEHEITSESVTFAYFVR